MLITKLNLSKDYAADPDHFTEILRKKYIYVVNDNYESVPERFD